MTNYPTNAQTSYGHDANGQPYRKSEQPEPLTIDELVDLMDADAEYTARYLRERADDDAQAEADAKLMASYDEQIAAAYDYKVHVLSDEEMVRFPQWPVWTISATPREVA